jgi:hypothetical protein
MCLPETVSAIHRDYVALPRPPQDPEKVQQRIKAMRDLLK